MVHLIKYGPFNLGIFKSIWGFMENVHVLENGRGRLVTGAGYNVKLVPSKSFGCQVPNKNGILILIYLKFWHWLEVSFVKM